MQKILFTGGGTAGHVMPNLALIAALKGEFECVYMGTDGQEKELCQRENIPFFTVPACKLRRDKILVNLALPFKLSSCVRCAKKLLKDISPALVFSKGGYAALPAVLAAGKLGIPVLCHESDLSPGLTTKLSAKRAKHVLCAFEPTAKRFKNGVYVGTPINARLRAAKRHKRENARPILLVTGGSSGAKTLNDVVCAAAAELTKSFDIIHITGKNKDRRLSLPSYTSMEYCYDMAGVYTAADVALSRAGAGTLGELMYMGIPTVAVPLEKASRGDQIENADYYAQKHAVTVLSESELTPDALVNAVKSAYAARNDFRAAISALPPIDGTARICDIIKQCVL